MKYRMKLAVFALALSSLLPMACGSEDTPDNAAAGAGGRAVNTGDARGDSQHDPASGGSSGSQGAAGSGGTGASGAGGGAGGSGGSSGSAGVDAGQGGTGGTAGNGTGGTAGNAGNAGSGGNAGVGGSAGTGQQTGTPTIVAVGYAGLRVASYDKGKTWTNKEMLSSVAADDHDNLRAVAYGNGVFVAVGHKLFTSPDGASWTRRSHPKDDQQWLGGVAFGNGRFVATGGYGYSAWSTDGIEWHEGGAIGTEASRSIAFGNGEFRSQTDPGNWYRSTDGVKWTLESGGHQDGVAFCAGAFKESPDCGPAFGQGVYVRAGGWNSGELEWSSDGKSWNSVDVGYPGGVNGFAFGYKP